jgi:pyruvate,water dikinase
VTEFTSPRLASILRRVSAIITNLGSSAGHLATVAREYGVPMIVDTKDATQLLSTGDEITVDAEENIIYRGVIKELLEYEAKSEDVFRDLDEYRILRRLLRRISPLYLLDPNDSNFTTKGCRTYHDIIRFCHEQAVKELINLNISSRRFRGVRSKKVNLPIPLGLYVIDLGGGLDSNSGGDTIESVEQIQSIPMKAVLKGMTSPGIWNTQPMQFGLDDFISSVTRYSLMDGTNEYQGQNLAVISECYCNINLRLGYHFNVIDTYVSENTGDNYIYFRFVGGVTESERRQLRAVLLKRILENMDFKVTVSGDLVIARLKRWEAQSMVAILEAVGRLVGFSRQLDTQMRSEESVELYFNAFNKLQQ